MIQPLVQSTASSRPTPRRRGPQALFFVFQTQSHIPSQQPALLPHPLIYGNWEGLCSLSGTGEEGGRTDILAPSLYPAPPPQPNHGLSPGGLPLAPKGRASRLPLSPCSTSHNSQRKLSKTSVRPCHAPAQRSEAAPSRPRPRWAGSAHLLRRLLSEACRCLTTTATLAGGSVSVAALACLGALDLALRHAAWNALPLLSTGSSKVLSLEPGPRPQSQCRVVLWDFMFFSEPLNI